MPRLIDADDLLMDNSWAFYDENGNGNDACIAVENAPTVEAVPVAELPYTVWLTHDVVQVVKCKDCKYWHTEGQFCDKFGVLWKEFYTAPYDYCSHGERREDAEIH